MLHETAAVTCHINVCIPYVASYDRGTHSKAKSLLYVSRSQSKQIDVSCRSLSLLLHGGHLQSHPSSGTEQLQNDHMNWNGTTVIGTGSVSSNSKYCKHGYHGFSIYKVAAAQVHTRTHIPVMHIRQLKYTTARVAIARAQCGA